MKSPMSRSTPVASVDGHIATIVIRQVDDRRNTTDIPGVRDVVGENGQYFVLTQVEHADIDLVSLPSVEV